jgi:hypothetical protein
MTLVALAHQNWPDSFFKKLNTGLVGTPHRSANKKGENKIKT